MRAHHLRHLTAACARPYRVVWRSATVLFLNGYILAVGETVILITPSFTSLLKHLLKVEEGAAE